MPYIKDDLAPGNKGLRAWLVPKADGDPLNAGELNFQIACLVDRFVELHGLSYEVINQITGTLNDVKTEFERRIVGPYEDKKCAQNGDVFRVSAGLL
jgi:hypothetical protein